MLLKYQEIRSAIRVSQEINQCNRCHVEPLVRGQELDEGPLAKVY